MHLCEESRPTGPCSLGTMHAINAMQRFDGKLLVQADADARGARLSQSAGDQLKEAPDEGLQLSELAAPGIEKGRMDMAFPAIGGDVHAAGSLVVDDGPPMYMPIFCCHLLPPNDEDYSSLGGIAQNKTAGNRG